MPSLSYRNKAIRWAELITAVSAYMRLVAMSVFHCNFGLTITFPKRRVTALFGVYPSPSSEHNAQILRAIRAYLTEDNPEFLKYVGRDFKNFGLKFNIALCNAFALRVPFSRKKPTRAIELALAEWNKKTPNQKQGWFNERRATQNSSMNVICGKN